MNTRISILYFSLLLFVVLKRGYFAPNRVYHNFDIGQKNDLHLPHVSLTDCISKGSFFTLVLKFLMLFPQQLRTFLAIPKSSKLLQSTIY